MHARRTLLNAGVTAAFAAMPLRIAQAGETLLSPNRRICVEIRPSPTRGRDLAVLLDGKLLFGCSRLGLDLSGTGPLVHDLRVVRAARSVVDDDYDMVCGKTARVRSRCNQIVLDLLEVSFPARRLQLIVRAYDDGIAFRYHVPIQLGLDRVSVKAELTRFDFPNDYTCWGSNLKQFDTGHEHEFEPMRTSQFAAADLFDAPLVCTAAPGETTFAIAEADLEHYAALYFTRRDDGAPGVQVKLSPRLDDPGLAVRGAPGRALLSPWRMVMIGDQPGRLIESNLITTLSAPSRIAETSWIRPGKAAWDWWSGVDLGSDTSSSIGNSTMMRLIDFAAATNLQYFLLDGGWYSGTDSKAGRPEVDVTRSRPGIDLPTLVEYGRQRRIGLFVWVRYEHLNRQLVPALDYYQKVGVKGVKVDYLNRDDQDMVAFCHDLLAKAAARQLMIDLHGASHCTGLTRTYPNLMTQEGVLGAEYNKWTRRVTSRHNVTLPFTRMLLGPMDYTPGGFRNVAPDQFVPQPVSPMVQTTRGQALAMYVVYDSPFACVSDSPKVYQGQPGVDFLAAVPTSWDETRVLSGRIGEFVAIARRSGRRWFVGAMTDATERTLAIGLTFLASGRFDATIYADGAEPSLLRIDCGKTVTSGDKLELALAANGGAAVVIQPIEI